MEKITMFVVVTRNKEVEFFDSLEEAFAFSKECSNGKVHYKDINVWQGSQKIEWSNAKTNLWTKPEKLELSN